MFRYALQQVLRHKLRTFLTSLGITLSVLLLSLIIFGMQSLRNVLVAEFSQRFNPNEIVVTNADFSFFSLGQSNNDQSKEQVIITQDIVDKIREHDTVEDVKPVVRLNGMKLEIAGQEKGISSAFVVAWNINGRNHFYSGYTGDRDTLNKGEAFISSQIVDSLKIKPDDVIGKTITLTPSQTSIFGSKAKTQLNKKFTFKVLGVIDPAQNRHDIVLNLEDGLAIQTELGGFADKAEYLKNFGYDTLRVSSKPDKVSETKDFLKNTLGLKAFTADDFLSFLNVITDGLTIALVFFGTVSAVVASIGIINTMIMSIYEQTREIGIIKALGASNIQVMFIYLIQSGFIGLFGGLMGLGTVLLIMKGLDPRIVQALVGAGFKLDTFFTYDLGLIAIFAATSTFVGMLAGLYPSLKAASLDPVKALRYE